MDPVAQGEAAPETANQETTQQENPFSGIQKRIDELVARNHEKDRENQQLLGRLEQQSQLLASLVAAQGQQREQPPPVEIDPEEMQKIQYVAQQMQAPLLNQFSALESQLVLNQVEQALARAGVTDADVAQKAKQYAAGWQQRGFFKQQIVTPDNAVELALGEKTKQQLAKQAQTQQLQNFNSFGQPMAPMAAPPQQVQQKEKDYSLEDIEADPSAAAAFYAKKLGF